MKAKDISKGYGSLKATKQAVKLNKLSSSIKRKANSRGGCGCGK